MTGQSRIAIRNIRRDANNELKALLKEKEITEDDDRRTQDEIQKMTDGHVKDVDQLLLQKKKSSWKSKTQIGIVRVPERFFNLDTLLDERSYELPSTAYSGSCSGTSMSCCHYYGWKWALG